MKKVSAWRERGGGDITISKPSERNKKLKE
jgi:hypothetical protein